MNLPTRHGIAVNGRLIIRAELLDEKEARLTPHTTYTVRKCSFSRILAKSPCHTHTTTPQNFSNINFPLSRIPLSVCSRVTNPSLQQNLRRLVVKFPATTPVYTNFVR